MNITKKIMSVTELVPQTINELLQELQREITLHEDDAFEIRLILEEAITNGIKHGNEFDTSRKVMVMLSLNNDQLTMTIQDEGEGFDYDNVPDPVEELDKLKTSGRGIFLIKEYAEDVRFNEAGTEIKIVKKLRGV